MSPARVARSSNWRVNSSTIKSVEGAHILRALRKVAGAVGLPASRKVRFNTNQHLIEIDPENDDIRIDAGDLFTKAPIPPENLDVLVGRTLHEVDHYTINTTGVWSSCYYRVPEKERDAFRAVVNIGEDIVIDHRLMSNANLRDYYEAAMDKVFSRRRAPRLNNIFELWIEYALAHNELILREVPFVLQRPMDDLVALTEDLKEPTDRLTGTRRRAELYVAVWGAIKDAVLHPPKLEDGDSKGEGGRPQETPPGNEQTKNSRTMPGPTDRHNPDKKQHDDDLPLMNTIPAPIDQKLAEAIEEAMTTDTEDITKQVYKDFEEAGYSPRNIAFVITRKQETKTIPVHPDADQVRRLERILTIRKRLQGRVMHGENYGKLDMRKLHRSQTDLKMFKLKYRFPDGFPDCAILVDMSGSMSGKQAEEVITAATSLALVVKCKVWAYAEHSSEIKLVKLDEGKVTHGSAPGGNTPSGIALVGVAQTLKPGGLIVHLTDGEHNVEYGPAEATQVLNRKAINAVHLLWGKHEGPYAGLPCKLLPNGLTDFPEALYWILIEQLRLEGLGVG
jgi:uncharacterized protein (UPF0297 family)